eukprot:m.122141 g.122141  ORF g.122141 m.122141 type:complete len:394 (-) comp23312_c0_seq2:29-1210(-)
MSDIDTFLKESWTNPLGPLSPPPSTQPNQPTTSNPTQAKPSVVNDVLLPPPSSHLLKRQAQLKIRRSSEDKQPKSLKSSKNDPPPLRLPAIPLYASSSFPVEPKLAFASSPSRSYVGSPNKSRRSAKPKNNKPAPTPRRTPPGKRLHPLRTAIVPNESATVKQLSHVVTQYSEDDLKKSWQEAVMEQLEEDLRTLPSDTSILDPHIMAIHRKAFDSMLLHMGPELAFICKIKEKYEHYFQENPLRSNNLTVNLQIQSDETENVRTCSQDVDLFISSLATDNERLRQALQDEQEQGNQLWQQLSETQQYKPPSQDFLGKQPVANTVDDLYEQLAGLLEAMEDLQLHRKKTCAPCTTLESLQKTLAACEREKKQLTIQNELLAQDIVALKKELDM